MPAYFENGVFTDATPAWHGLGVTVPDEHLTRERIYELVPELGSEVVKTPIFAAYSDGEGFAAPTTERYYANVRALDKKILGVVGNRYELIQPDEMMSFGEDIIDAGGKWKTAGTLGEGELIWGLLELPGEIKIGGLADEAVTPYLMVTNSYDGSARFGAYATWTRVVCWNTWNMAISGAPTSYTLRHTESAAGRLQDARDALRLTFKLGEEIQQLGDTLLAKKLDGADLTRFIKQLIPNPEIVAADDADTAQAAKDAIAKAQDRRFDLRKVIVDSPNLENVRGTAWAALQGTIEYTQRYEVPGARAQSILKRAVLAPSALNTRALSLLSA
jgi:phage/plasmid-like protein (TIGR03299 family)